jgi:outer membrane translocation and assembly module TamA
MDMAIFYEVGKVANRTGDLDFEDLHDSYGIGARFHGPALTALRIELARSDEGIRLIFSGGAAF